jgi:site-specific DNA-cytosine methylase
VTTKKSSKKKQTTAEEAPGRAGKGINLGLTESPLIALEEFSRGQSVYISFSSRLTYLIALEKDGYPSIPFQHEFSAEIEVFKQAFIERNLHPKLLFRDVRDLIQEPFTTAITAYGAEADIPTGIDILIAGFVCKDLSRMNNKGKTLKDGGESGDTWLAVHTYAKRFRPSMVLLENLKSENATWQGVVSQWDSIGYEAVWMICDSKNYYLPQIRLRMYMIAINRDRFGKGATEAVGQWEDSMRKLERQVSSPYEAFLPGSLK